MLTFSFLLAVLTFIGFAFLWSKFPKWIKDRCTKHALIFDCVVSLGVYVFLGTTLMALMSAAMFGIMVSVYLWFVNMSRESGKQPTTK